MRLLAAAFAAALLSTASPCIAVPGNGGIGIAAVVDDQVVSSLDLEGRMALVLATTGIPDTAENRQRLTPQVLHQLVDEILQMQEAQRQNITIGEDKIRGAVSKIEAQSGKPPGSLEEYLTSTGVPISSFHAQIRAQLAWSEVVLRRIRPQVRVSDAEVERYTTRSKPKRAAAPQQQPQSAPTQAVKEVQIAVIILPVDSPQSEPRVKKAAEQLAAQIRGGASFDAVARQFSSGTGSVKTAEPFWVETAQLAPVVSQALARTQKGGITAPVRAPNGYQIIRLVDLKTAPAPKAAAPAPQPQQAAPASTGGGEAAELVFKQILMTLKPDAKDAEAEMLLKLARQAAKSPGKCEDRTMAGVGDLEELEFDVSFTRAVSTELPEKLRELLMSLRVGQVSMPVVTPQGVRLFMLCERTDLPAGSGQALAPAPSADAIRQAIYAEKLELEAQKFMRDLRRDSFIEMRAAQQP